MNKISQKIISTEENQKQQKLNVFYSSSTVFWCIFDRDKNLDTSISFLNHFFLKKNISSVSMRLSIRDLSGKLISEIIKEINKPKAYSFSISKLVPKGIIKGEYGVFIEFTSFKNLNVPFCAVVMTITSPNTVDQIHTYGRALEVNEINSNIDFATSYESGWTINPSRKVSNLAILHNGRIFSEIDGYITLLKKGIEIGRFSLLKKKLSPFSTLKIDLEDLLEREGNLKVNSIIENSQYGEIDAKVVLNGLKGTFPRLLLVSLFNEKSNDKVTETNFEQINITHSNFDFSNASQPRSRINFGFINNPSYPKGVNNTGFRYYPCEDLENLNIKNLNSLDSSLINLPPLSSLKVSSSNPLPSRIVGSNWVKWNKSNLIKECSTGTHIVEYSESKAFWHWGLLSPCSDIFEGIISLINPFSIEEEKQIFELRIFSENGLVNKQTISFSGKNFSINFKSGELEKSKNKLWYVLNGEGVGTFNVFATFFFPDLRDGSIEHAF